MKKKALAMLLAAAMTLSMSAAAFAADDELGSDALAEDKTIEFTAETKAPTIKILVPAADKVLFNPYGMAFKASEVASGGDSTTDIYDQVFNVNKFIQNQSTVAIQVQAAVTAVVTDGMKLSSTAVKDTATDKQVHIKLDYAVQNDTSTTPTWAAKGVTAVAPSSKAPTKTTLGILAMGTGTALGDANGVLAYRISGNATPNPKTAWTGDDTVTVTAYFSFLPQTTEQSGS